MLVKKDHDEEGEEMEERLEEDDSDLEFSVIPNYHLPKHVRCASHTLNLIAPTDVKNAIQKNTALRTKHTNAVLKCNTLWKMASRPKSNEIIHQVLGHTLSYPGVTRWNSLYDSVSQILKDNQNLKSLFEKLNIRNSMFKDTELHYLKEYCLVLQPLARALDVLQGDKKIFFGYFFSV